MSTYAISNYTLEFNASYTSLHVVQDEENIETFDLTDPESPICVAVEGSDYLVTTGEALGDGLHKYDTDGGQADLGFVGTRLGGIGVVDLRDCGKSGNFTVDYDLECGSVRMLCVPGPKAFRVKVSDPACYTYVDNE